MTKFYSITDPIKYEGPDSKNALAYRWYNPKQKVLGKSMAEHLRFAVCYWHTLCWPGTDPFGGETFNRQWHHMADPMAAAATRAGPQTGQFKLKSESSVAIQMATSVAMITIAGTIRQATIKLVRMG